MKLDNIGIYLLILYHIVCCGGWQIARWIQYADKAVALCAQQNNVLTNSHRLAMIALCVKHQKMYLHCVDRTELPIATSDSQQSLRFQPCGWLGFLETKPTTMAMWKIRVQRDFTLNITFLYVRLPMPHQRCSQRTAPSHLLLHSVPPSALQQITICGKRDRTELIWPDYKLDIYYESILMQVNNNSFLMKYQICAQSCKPNPVHVIHQINSTFTEHRIGLLSLSYALMIKGTAKYSVHIIGHKLSSITFRIGTPKSVLQVTAFEGPGPRKVHQHPDSESLYVAKWITFVTFQCYTQIMCSIVRCSSVLLYYKVEDKVNVENIYTQRQIRLHPDSPSYDAFQLSSYDMENQYLSYQSIVITSSIEGHEYQSQFGSISFIQLEFMEINFLGPSYPDYMTDDTCLLGGVSVMDAYPIISKRIRSAMFLTEDPDMEDLIIDTLFPTITLCSSVFYIDGDGSITYKLPLTKFVSTTDTIIVVIYAYGGYVNLQNSNIKLRVQQTSCMGLFIYCPVLTGNGIIFVERNQWPNQAKIQPEVRMLERCSGQHMLMVALRIPLWLPSGGIDNEYYFYIYYCQENSSFPWRSNSSFFMAGFRQSETKSGHLCLVLQTNPFDGPSSTRADQCNYVDHMQSTHEYIYLHFYDILSLQLCQNVPCGIGMAIDSYGNRFMNEIALWQNEGKQLFISYETRFIKLEMEVHLECQGFVSVSGYTDPVKWENRVPVSHCPFHVISFNDFSSFNESAIAHALKWNVTISLSQIYHWIASLADLPPIPIDDTISGAFLIVKSYTVIRLKQNAKFPRECQDIELSIIYRDYTGNNLMTMTWNADFRQNNDFIVHLYTVPFLNILLLIRGKVSKKPFKVTACDVLVDKHMISVKDTSRYIATASERRTFLASYTYLWTLRNLSWNAANDTCSDLGMHLVSITSEDELDLVREFLIDETLLTPCRLETPLCVIYIGLQVKVGS